MRAQGPGRRGWIDSPAYDLPLISLAPLLGLAVAALAYGVGEQTLIAHHFVELNLFFVGMPHYLSTYTFFLDDENVRHYQRRRLAFFAGPVIVIGLLTASFALRLYLFVAAAVAIWNVFHVSRQSIGILSTYRHIGGGDNRVEKRPSNVSLLALASGLFLLNASRPTASSTAWRLLQHDLAPFIAYALLGIGFAALAIVAFRMVRRSAAAPEWIFLGASVALFAPFLLISDLMLATTAMLTGHYVQYLGLLWLLNRRKYAGAVAPPAKRFLGAVSGSIPLLLTLLVALAVVPFLFDRLVHQLGLNALHAWALNSVVLLHFYFDGLFWAFRDPYTRQSLAPFLVTYHRHERLPAATAAPLTA